MSDEKQSEVAGSASSGKDLGRLAGRPELKTRRARLLRKIREDEKKQMGAQSAKKDNATAGDDFYADVLARFGIEI